MPHVSHPSVLCIGSVVLYCTTADKKKREKKKRKAKHVYVHLSPDSKKGELSLVTKMSKSNKKSKGTKQMKTLKHKK